MAERGARVRGADTSLVDLLPPPGPKRLAAGDYVEAVVEHVVIPQRAKDYYGPNRRLAAALQNGENTWKMVSREARGNDLDVVVARGRLKRLRPLAIEARDNAAEFSVAGGLGYVPMTITGLKQTKSPVLQKKVAGRWESVDQSVHGKDFWQTDYDASAGTWEITYSVPLDTPNDERRAETFRFFFAGRRQDR